MNCALNDWNLMLEFVQICFEHYKLIVLQYLPIDIKIDIRNQCKDICPLAQISFRDKEMLGPRVQTPVHVHCKVCNREVIRQSALNNFVNPQQQVIHSVGLLICRSCFNRPDLHLPQRFKHLQSLLSGETLKFMNTFMEIIVKMQAAPLNETSFTIKIKEYAKESVERIDTAIKKTIIELLNQEIPIITEVVKAELDNTNAIIQHSLRTLDTFKNELTTSRIQSSRVENVAARGRWDSERNAREQVFSNQLTTQMIGLMEQNIRTKREKSTTLRSLLEDGERIMTAIRPLIEPENQADQSQVVQLGQPEREEVVAVENRTE